MTSEVTPPTDPSAPPLRVMVTGGTGFVGFHTVQALREAGHEVRLLVRSLEKMRRVFEPFGLEGLEAIVGDITDQASVEAALDGCNAVVHSAAMVSVLEKDADRVVRTNLRGTQLVLGGAVDRGIDRIVQVSSTTALWRPSARRIDENSPLGKAPTGYGRSKVECDRYIRRLQEDGAPIYTTYPGSVIGPNDPGLSEAVAGMKLQVEGGAVAITSSGIQLVDARDLALAHRMLLEKGGPPARYPLGGHYFRWEEFADLLEEVTGRSFWRVPMPAAAMRFFGSVGDLAHRFIDFEGPLSLEASTYATQWAVADDSLVLKTLGFELRDARVSLRDTIRWLVEAGHLPPEHAL